jgi:glutamyl-tRNA synthetase
VLAEIDGLVAFDYAREWHARPADEDEKPEDHAARVARWDALVELARHGDRDFVRRCVALEQERVHTLVDFGEACAFFLADLPAMDPKARDKWLTQAHVPALLGAIAAAAAMVPEGYEEGVAYWETVLRDQQEQLGLDKLGPIVHPTRVALTGKTFGPGLFELMAVLGSARIRRRIAACQVA